MKNERKAPQVQSLVRALDILEFAAQHAEGVSLSEIAELLGVSQGAAFNLSSTLVSRGYLRKSTRPVRFTIGDTLIDLGLRHAESQLTQKIADIMQQLSLRYRDINTLFVVPTTYQLLVKLRTDPSELGIVQRPSRALDNPYAMITSLTLLAFLDEESRNRILQRYPFAEFSNREMPDLETLYSLFRSIQTQGYAWIPNPEDGRRPRAAYPIYDRNGQLFGTLGISLLSHAAPHILHEIHDFMQQTGHVLVRSRGVGQQPTSHATSTH